MQNSAVLFLVHVAYISMVQITESVPKMKLIFSGFAVPDQGYIDMYDTRWLESCRSSTWFDIFRQGIKSLSLLSHNSGNVCSSEGGGARHTVFMSEDKRKLRPPRPFLIEDDRGTIFDMRENSPGYGRRYRMKEDQTEQTVADMRRSGITEMEAEAESGFSILGSKRQSKNSRSQYNTGTSANAKAERLMAARKRRTENEEGVSSPLKRASLSVEALTGGGRRGAYFMPNGPVDEFGQILNPFSTSLFRRYPAPKLVPHPEFVSVETINVTAKDISAGKNRRPASRDPTLTDEERAWGSPDLPSEDTLEKDIDDAEDHFDGEQQSSNSQKTAGSFINNSDDSGRSAGSCTLQNKCDPTTK